MTNDGLSGSLFGRVSRDVYGFKLGYYNDDYIPIDVTHATAFDIKAYTAPASLENTGNQLFNGNISYTMLALSHIGDGATTGYSYGYDQLNRLVQMRQHTTGTHSGWSNSDIISAYAESIAYDANGNILQYLRKGTAATLDMDSLNYKYNRDEDGRLINNRLVRVRDAVDAGNYAADIDDQGHENNYTYDLIGNLTKDIAASLNQVDWTVYGKIHYIWKGGNDFIEGETYYRYDASGNRTYKEVNDYAGAGTTKTFYVRDAQGNVLAVYTKKNSDPLKWAEQHLYGSSRLGMWQWDTIVPALPPVVDEGPLYDSILLGSRTYELSNHLGNVLSTISDKKIGNDSSGVVNYYIAEVLSQNDYYPGGMLMPGRKYGTLGRHGFNGKEQDPEVSGEGNQYDYGFRIYDPRIVRFKSVDPLTKDYPWYTPYQFAGNTPIQAIDLDGLEELHYTAINHDQRTAQITIRKHYEIVNTGANRVTDPAYIAAQALIAANVYNTTSHTYRFVKALPTSNQSMRQAGLFSKLGFAIGNLFNSSAKREANYRRKYWTVEVRYDIQVRNTPGMTEANANAAINLNHNLNGKITEQALANPNAAAAAPHKTPNANDPNDDEVRLNTTYFGAGGVNRGQIGANGTGNGGELIAHEIGHNLHPNTHPGTDGTSASYPTSGIGSNRAGLAPSKSETKTILQSSRHTLPANPPR